MAYNPLNLPDGTVVTAAHFAHIETGLDDAFAAADAAYYDAVALIPEVILTPDDLGSYVTVDQLALKADVSALTTKADVSALSSYALSSAVPTHAYVDQAEADAKSYADSRIDPLTSRVSTLESGGGTGGGDGTVVEYNDTELRNRIGTLETAGYITPTYLENQQYVTQNALSSYATLSNLASYPSWSETDAKYATITALNGKADSSALTGLATKTYTDSTFQTKASMTAYAVKTDTPTKTELNTAITGANTYADGLNTAMDTRVDALEAQPKIVARSAADDAAAGAKTPGTLYFVY